MNIILTGASRGIGYQTAIQLVEKKANKLILISRNANKLNELINDCKQINQGTEIISIPYDLEDILEDSNSLYKLIKSYTETVDVLINNAGYLESKHFEKAEMEGARKMFNVNFFAAAALIRLSIPFFKTSTCAHIVNIGSMAGFQGSSKFEGMAFYSASKAALASFSECLAEELKERKIAVNCLALGAVETEMLEEAFPGYKAPITSPKMAEFIADFALNGQKYFNGKIIPVSLSTP